MLRITLESEGVLFIEYLRFCVWLFYCISNIRLLLLIQCFRHQARHPFKPALYSLPGWQWHGGHRRVVAAGGAEAHFGTGDGQDSDKLIRSECVTHAYRDATRFAIDGRVIEVGVVFAVEQVTNVCLHRQLFRQLILRE